MAWGMVSNNLVPAICGLAMDSFWPFSVLVCRGTSETRSHSLFRQGCMLYDLIPNRPEYRLNPLIERFATAVLNAGVCT